MSQPDISVIIPAYKAAATISRSLTPLMEPQHVDVEIIVVEDGPLDNTSEVVATFPNVNFISLPVNKGVCYARNTGLANARSEFVLFLDADDTLEGPVLEGMLEIFRSEQADLVFAPWRFGGPSAGDETIKHGKRVDTDDWLGAWAEGREWAWACPARIGWRRSSLIAIGGWNLGFSKKEDTEIMVRALTSGLNFGVSDRGCGVYWREQTDTARSYKFSDEILRCQWGIYILLKKWLFRDTQTRQKLQQGLGDFCDRVAALAITQGYRSEGVRWLKEAKSLGTIQSRGITHNSILLTALWLKYRPTVEWHIKKLRNRIQRGDGTTETD